MRLRLGVVSALLVISCAPSRQPGVSSPAPVVPDVAPRPAAPRPLPPAIVPVAVPSPDTLHPMVVVAPADSAKLAKQARDSALDAVGLERVATAHPPETPASSAPGELTPAGLRARFDIDVAHWVDQGRVKYYLDFFTGPVRERMAIWLERMPRYEPAIRAQLVAHGLPGDLAYLPLIESGYSPTAVSRTRAVGMWQFMRGTGRLYGLQVDSWVDERRDIPKATDAAIRFLADLTAKFGSPYLAAAAYNGGPGRIERGLARIDPGDEGPQSDDSTAAPQARDAAFFQLADTRYIKRETKDYVPKLIAAALIAKQPERYGFPAILPARAQRMDSVVVTDATGLDVIGRLSGLSLADLWASNPMYIRAVTPPKRRALVWVPVGMGARTQEALEALPASERLTSFPHHAKSGETLARIAKRYGLTAAELKGFNPALAARAPRTGEVVRIPGRARLSGWVAENRRVVAEREGRVGRGGTTHRVQPGETLGSIGARYRVSVAKLRSWNNLRADAVLRVGQVITVRAGRPSSSPKPATPARRVHVVRAGETLASLAHRYGVTVEALRVANSIPTGRPLVAGRRLTIPS